MFRVFLDFDWLFDAYIRRLWLIFDVRDSNDCIALVTIPAAMYLLVEKGIFGGSTSVSGLRY